MARDERQIALEGLLQMPEVVAWCEIHEQEVALFERHLRRIAPRDWREEFVRTVLQSVEQVERD